MNTFLTLVSVVALTASVASNQIIIEDKPSSNKTTLSQQLHKTSSPLGQKVLKIAATAYQKTHLKPNTNKRPAQSNHKVIAKTTRFEIKNKINHLSQKAPQLSKKVLTLALTAYQKARTHGSVKKPVLTVIDYSLPSWKQRMWIFDMNKERLLYHTYVAHGRNSGLDVPNHFSNQFESKATSLGTYLTKDTYIGSKGYSLNLQGLEKGFNDNAYNRRVVIHGAWYVEPDFIKRAGRAGRSWGCPSIAKTLAKPVINTIKGGSVVFAYFPDRNYLSHSGFIA